MKSQLTKDSSSNKTTSPQDKQEEDKKMFSPQSQSKMSNFFNTKGPIKPANMLPTQAMVNGPIIPVGHGNFQLHQRPQGLSQQQEEDYSEEGDYDDELDYGLEESGGDPGKKAGGRVLSPEEEERILHYLAQSAKHNREFLKVLNILQNDPELRPLIFEHEALLKALKDMGELKAEQMLSILTAAETEMYETSKKNEETQQLQRSQNLAVSAEKKDMRNSEVQTINTEDRDSEKLEKFKRQNEKLVQEKADL